MRAVLRARLGQLTDGARRLAEVAAVIGRPFSVGLVVSSPGPMNASLWIMSTNSGVTGSSRSGKLTVTISVMTSFGRLPAGDNQSGSSRQLHRAVAEAIAVERDKDIDAASRGGRTYDEAGMIELAIDAYRVAGGRRWRCRPRRSGHHVRRALALLADLPPSPTATHSNSTSGSPWGRPCCPGGLRV